MADPTSTWQEPTFETITKTEALDKLFALWRPEPTIELVPLAQAAGRILAIDQVAHLTLPVVRASKMDGYAVRSADFSVSSGTPDAAATPLPDTTDWRYGENYVRADTGDDFDDRFDAVVRVEDVRIAEDGHLLFAENLEIQPGTGVNPAGSQVCPGNLLARAGLPLRAYDLAMLAMGGVSEPSCIRKPRVGFIPTGSELVPAGSTPERGQNIDSGSVLAEAALCELGAEPLIHPIVIDDLALIETALNELLPHCDILLLSGGSSKGLEDYSASLLKQRGELICHGVLAAPGRPTCIAIIDGKPVVNVSGPVLALYHELEWLVAPLVARALGVPTRRRPSVRAPLTADIAMRPFPDGRVMQLFHRLSVSSKDGALVAAPLGSQRGKSGPPLLPNAQFLNPLGTALYPAGSELEVELLYPLEFID
ncbi:MAG: molybdopterin molybdotransferase MoeA [Coriobacteriales bacterium]|jgi:molybdopterin molybdotransferase/putative molybdopterin biosynthesis protein|nr:molybdopterin molybdotransferase MoeA [Coriobacteriales bacterium]